MPIPSPILDTFYVAITILVLVYRGPELMKYPALADNTTSNHARLR
jgi:hypothetical protein